MQCGDMSNSQYPTILFPKIHSDRLSNMSTNIQWNWHQLSPCANCDYEMWSIGYFQYTLNGDSTTSDHILNRMDVQVVNRVSYKVYTTYWTSEFQNDSKELCNDGRILCNYCWLSLSLFSKTQAIFCYSAKCVARTAHIFTNVIQIFVKTARNSDTQHNFMFTIFTDTLITLFYNGIILSCHELYITITLHLLTARTCIFSIPVLSVLQDYQLNNTIQIKTTTQQLRWSGVFIWWLLQ